MSANNGAQAPDNKGTDFFLAFPQNVNGTPPPGHRMTLFLATEDATKVEISGPMVVTRSFELPASSVLEVFFDLGALQVSPGISNKGIRVRSIDAAGNQGAPIAVYGLNRRIGSAGAYVALPVDVLGTRYRTIQRPGTTTGPGSQVTVVGSEDGTTVYITTRVDVPSVATAGVPFEITLDHLQTFLLQLPVGDLTGTLVTADKPVAVFSGNQNSPVTGASPDHMIEQMVPVTAWGSEFIVAPIATSSPTTTGDFVRVIADEADTSVELNGQLKVVLGPGEFYEFNQPAATGSWITTSKRSLVAHYNQAEMLQKSPFVMLVPPVNGYSRHYLFKTPRFIAPGENHHLNIVVKDGDEPGLLLNNAALPSATVWTSVNGYRYARVMIPPGTGQLLEHSEPTVRFGAWVYGHASGEGYGFAAGQLVNTPPICSAAGASTSLIWPPNRQLVAVGVTGVVDPDGDDVTIEIATIFQDEPTSDAGDSSLTMDGFGVGTSVAQVRAERGGDGNGRVYHIGFTATDRWGASCTGEITVGVPHSQGRSRGGARTGGPVDDGALYDSTAL